MLLTICSNCEAQFKVTPEQLNVRQGRVMCGRCRTVFNAFQSLERVDDDVVSTRTAAAPSTSTVASVDDSDDTTQSGFPRLSHDTRPRPSIPHDEYAGPPSGTLPPEVVEDISSGIDSLDDVTPLSDSLLDDIELPTRIGPAPVQPPAPPADASRPSAPYRGSAGSALPTFAKKRASRGWTGGACLALLALTGQCLYLFRMDVVAAWPEVRPAFARACDFTGCSLAWSRDENAVRIESSGLIEEIGEPGRFLLTGTISNRGRSMQDFPFMELTLTDTSNQTLTRRVLQPSDYLGRPVRREEGMAPNSEITVNLRVQSNNSRASGYNLLLFYP
jgi:predicted Zn finger-like uncharacterized protein